MVTSSTLTDFEILENVRGIYDDEEDDGKENSFDIEEIFTP